MKTMIIAGAAALSLSMGVAYADGEGGQVANTFFTELPGVLAQAPVQNARPVATAQSQNGPAVHTYVTQSSHGTWLVSALPGQRLNRSSECEAEGPAPLPVFLVSA